MRLWYGFDGLSVRWCRRTAAWASHQGGVTRGRWMYAYLRTMTINLALLLSSEDREHPMRCGLFIASRLIALYI